MSVRKFTDPKTGSVEVYKRKRAKWSVGNKILFAILIFLVLFLTLFVGGNLAFTSITGTSINDCYQEAMDTVEQSTEDTFRLNATTNIYYADGSKMASLSQGYSSNYLEFEEIPEAAVNAFVAVEDRSFWTNEGYDIKAIARAALSILANGGEINQGGSTITQQLCKLVFLSNEQTLERKVREVFLAYGITQKYSKEQIMEWYVNYCCFANNIYGLKDAANAYLGKEVDELSLSEICYLCAIPNLPEYYDPWNHQENAIERRDQILNDMLELEMISQADYDAAIQEEILVLEESSRVRLTYNDETMYAIQCATETLMKQNGFEFENSFETMQAYEDYQDAYDKTYSEANQQLYIGGYTIMTSIDSDSQDSLQAILDETLEFDTTTGDNDVYNLQGAITVVDNRTSKVVAIVGRRTQENVSNVNYNRAYQYTRQPGSVIKPLIVYAPALEIGYTADSILKDIDVQEAYEAYEENEAFTQLTGPRVTLRESVEESLNGTALYLYEQITPERGLSYLLQMDFQDIVPNDYYLSSALGGLTYGVNTVEMAAAYSSLVNFGNYTPADCILSMTDGEGNAVYEEPDSSDVYDSNAAIEMTDIMMGVLERGTGAHLEWNDLSTVPAAAKTGTTNNSTNGWFCGYTAPYTISVWVGNDDNTPVDDLSGETYPAYIWRESMLTMLEGYDMTADHYRTVFDYVRETEDTEDNNSILNSIWDLLNPDNEEDTLTGEETPGNAAGMWRVVDGGANVRDGASSDSNVVFALEGGTEVYVVSYDEYWTEVLIDGETYYIYTPLLEPISE